MIFVYILIGLIFFAGDFLSKRYILSNVALVETFGSLTPLIDFTYVQNRGAAFSILSGKINFLALISILFCIGLIIFVIIKKPKNKLLCISLAMIFSGALGNAIDRLFYGFVVDFIETTFVDFAVFNIADIGITVGAFLLAIYVIFFDRETRSEQKE